MVAAYLGIGAKEDRAPNVDEIIGLLGTQVRVE